MRTVDAFAELLTPAISCSAYARIVLIPHALLLPLKAAVLFKEISLDGSFQGKQFDVACAN